MNLYGTRDAAANWQDLVARKMRSIGFVRGVYNPCTYYHPERSIRAMVHGDDYVSTGRRSDLRLLQQQLGSRFRIIGTHVVV